MSGSTSGLPARPSLEQLRKRAKELLRAVRAGDSAAADRFRAQGRNPLDAILADAQHVIAREHGFSRWADLAHHVDLASGATPLKPLIRPVEMRSDRTRTLDDGAVVSSDDEYRMFVAARAGDLVDVKALVAREPGLALVEYNYTPPIHFAVREGHLELVQFFLDRGADIAYRSYPFGDSLLEMAEDREHVEIAALLRPRLAQRFALGANTREIIDAAKAGDLRRVKAELSRNPGTVRASNETGDTPLHHAAFNGHLDVVQALLVAGADPDAIRGDGYRPIHLALQPNWRARVPERRRNAIADLLLERGARYTMFLAALRDDMPFIRENLGRDRALANEEDTSHQRPLSGAATRNNLEMVRLLVDHGANPILPEIGAPRGNALWTAVNDRRREMTRLLLAHGADPNGMVESSGTPMMRAEGDRELTELLEKHGGKVDRDESREAIGTLVGQRRFAEAERMLRERPDIIPGDDANWGDGPLAGPARDGNHDVIAMLMRLGARVPLVSKWAPFYYFKHEATATFLLENGMDPNHMNWHRLTLLHHMAAEGEMAKARLLVRHGADIDAIDEEYRSTPLGLAARRGQLDMVKFLLDSAADPSLSAAPWATPLAWARKRGHHDVERALVAAGAS